MNKTFVLTDESENSYGSIVRTPGIKLDNFLKNPVMFYNHDRGQGVIGKWENVRVEGSRILGEPVFDERDELAMKIKNKVEGGFIKAASIGIYDVIMDSGKVISSCEMYECSIVDIPANKNAFVLYDDNKNVINNVEQFFLNFKSMGLLEQLGTVLCLEHPTEEDVIDSVTRLVKTSSLPGNITLALKRAMEIGIVENDTYEMLLSMGKQNPGELMAHLAKVEKKKMEGISSKLDHEFSERHRKLLYQPYQSIEKMKNFALKGVEYYNLVMELVDNMPDQYPMGEYPVFLDTQNPGNVSMLDDYRKNRPEELRDNPQLYKRLLEQEENQKNQRR